jgi:CheY-like chemotaxis protein
MNENTTILIVEDSALLRAVVADALTGEHFTVLEAENGKIGLDTALEKHPDLIMLDVMMPVMGGVEALALLRKDPWGATVPVIILTGTRDEHLIEQLKADARVDFLLKENWMMDEVINHVKKGLDMHNMHGLDAIVEHVKQGVEENPSH